MAKKVQAVNILPAPSSSDEETDDSTSNSNSSTDDEESEPVVNKPALQQPSLQSQQESEDEDSDETRISPSAFIVKPSLPKTTRVKARAKRPADSQELDKPSVSKNKKNKVSDDGDGHSVAKLEKGKKVVSGDEESAEIEEKKSIIKWTDKDEIALLDGIIEYKVETGDDVNSKTDAFYDFVKGLLSVRLKKNQLFEKIKRLKKKFQTNAEKLKNGEGPVFSRPNDNKLFELSQKIWGTVSDGNVSKVKSSKKKDKKNSIVVSNTGTGTPLKSPTKKELFVQEEIKDTIMEVQNDETEDYWLLYPRLCASLESEASGYLTVMEGNLKEHVKKIISGMSKEKARYLEDEWKDIHLMDAQIFAKRAHLISKQADVLLDISNRKQLGR